MAKDKLHDLVEIALIKDGWVNIESTTLKYQGTDLNLDIIADKLISAEKENVQIAVEVKSFGNPSITYDFHQALGQYLNYRMVLTRLNINRIPYLAIPERIYTKRLTKPFFQDSLSFYCVNLFTIDISSKEIVRWNPSPLLP